MDRNVDFEKNLKKCLKNSHFSFSWFVVDGLRNREDEIEVGKNFRAHLNQEQNAIDYATSKTHTNRRFIGVYSKDLNYLGVDAEKSDRVVDEKVWKRIFSEKERELFSGREIEGFTVKEACFKACSSLGIKTITEIEVVQRSKGGGLARIFEKETIEWESVELEGYVVTLAWMNKKNE